MLLLRTCFFGTMPARFNLATKTWYARVSYKLQILSDFQGFNDNCITVDFDHDHKIFVAALGFLGELASLIEKRVLRTSYTFVYTSHCFLPLKVVLLEIPSGRGDGLVDLTCFRVWFIHVCPFGVSIVSG